MDRAALPQPDSVQIAQDEYVAPTAAANARTKIFEEVLHMDPVANRAGIADSQQPRDGHGAAPNGLPTLGQFQRNRRTGSNALH
jgi:hypothetical protein